MGTDGQISGRILIETASVDTGQAKRDEHLRKDSFLGTRSSPNIEVAVTHVDLLGLERATVRLVLVARGRTAPHDIDVTLDRSEDGSHVVVSGSATVNRAQLGVAWNPLRVASLDVDTTFSLTFVRSTP